LDLSVPCTFDFNVAATKYFYGIESGDVPLMFLFNGAVFYEDNDGRLQLGPIPFGAPMPTFGCRCAPGKR
jgi:hypothetical protein